MNLSRVSTGIILVLSFTYDKGHQQKRQIKNYGSNF
jgi:hypothetical protein